MRRALVMQSLMLVLLVATACVPPCPPCPPTVTCPPSPTCPDTSALQTRLAGCEATLTAVAEGPGPCTPTGNTEAACDGIDDDCDGESDEDYEADSCGIGACQRLSVCVAGVESCTPGEPQPELCDNQIDDDCDGVADREDSDCVCPGAIPPEEASRHIGEVRTVQGTVVDASYRPDIGGEPTFLNFCRPYPDHCFTALIWGGHRQEFIDCLGGQPEDVLLNQQVCVTGLIEEHKGKPEIILTACDQLEVVQ